MMHVEVIGDKALIAKFEASLKAMDAAKPATLRKSGMAIQMNIRDTIWKVFQQRTGDLFNSVRIFYQTKNGISVGTGKGLDYAEPLELGSVPHIIVAKGGQESALDSPNYQGLLTFWWEKAGMFFVGPYVWHPGNRPYRYVYAGTVRAMPQVYRYCCDMVAVAFGIPMK